MVNKVKKTQLNRESIPDFDPTVPSREALLEFLRTHTSDVTVKTIVTHFKLKKAALVGLDRRINAMERDGQIAVSVNGLITLLTSDKWVQGVVQGHRDGFGFLIPDQLGQDIYLSYKEMQKVMHGDRAVVKVVGTDNRGRLEGIILEVLGSNLKRIVGRVCQEGKQYLVAPEDKRITHDILIKPVDLCGAKENQIVCVELLNHPNRQVQAQGKVVEILGGADDPGMEIEIAVRKFDVPHEFSSACLALSEKLPNQVVLADIKGRVDLRDVPFITIDGADARDFDDAVYVEATTVKSGRKTLNAWRLLVAIADVSHYVSTGDAIDADAIERSTSVYFPRRVIPMLPEKLSNGLCSLVPNEDRLTLVCDMVIPAEGPEAGTIQAYQFYNAVIHSAARTTYDEVWAIIAGLDGLAYVKHQHVVPQINDMYALFQVLVQARRARGAIDFETTETKMVIGELGRIEKIEPLIRNDAHKVIEEAMLAANTCAADFIGRSHHHGLYRVHEGPSEDRLNTLREFLRSLGLTLGGGADPQALDYAKLIQQVKDRPDASLIQTMALRSLHQAIYSPDNLGHFGLAYKAYTHFTSPIRRYPDLLTHRVIKALIQGQRYIPRSLDATHIAQTEDQELANWEALGLLCSKHERRADEASRDVEAWLKAQFMKDRVGEIYSGHITGVAQFGLFVTLDQLYVEGLIHISDLDGDYYIFNDALHELRGERTGKRYRLTDKLQVKVARVDIDTRRVEFVLLTSPDRKGSTKISPASSKGAKPHAASTKKAGSSSKKALSTPKDSKVGGAKTGSEGTGRRRKTKHK